MIKQCKGKDFNKLPKTKIDWIKSQKWYISKKYDGQYCQIHKIGNKVKFFTSGGKEFYLKDIATYLIAFNKNKDFILECEFIGESEGKLGDRTKCGILTTWRTEFAKGFTHKCENNIFKVFDIIDLEKTFEERLNLLMQIRLPEQLQIVKHKLKTLDEARNYLYEVTKNQGYEGLYLKHPNHKYYPGKRVNDAIKLKKRPTADLKCIDVLEGDGKYQGMIGSLVLVDSKGRIVSVGSGLSDSDRMKSKEYYLGKIIEIEYEQIIDTYIQPVFIGIREDKIKED